MFLDLLIVHCFMKSTSAHFSHLQTPHPEEIARIALHASSMVSPALSNHSYLETRRNLVPLGFMGINKTGLCLRWECLKEKA